jgi:oligoendopeptidase F
MLDRKNICIQFQTLLDQEIDSVESLLSWILSCDELDTKISQDYAWKYIRQTTNTVDQSAKKEYKEFLQDIYPERIKASDQIGRKLIASLFIDELPSEYNNFVRSVKHSVLLFREENISLFSEEKNIESQF